MFLKKELIKKFKNNLYHLDNIGGESPFRDHGI